MLANLSTKRCVGARCPCASCTDRAIRSRVVSPFREVTRNSSVPRSLMVPANTVAPAVFSTGMLSPVIGAWFTDDWPATTSPSNAMRSPGRTRTMLPSGTESALTSCHCPSGWRTNAFSGARSISLRMALRARSRLKASIISAIPKSQIPTAASGHCPIRAAPMTATVINRFMFSERVFSAIQPFLRVSTPPKLMATRHARMMGQEASDAPAKTMASAPSASTPETAIRIHCPREMLVPKSRGADGSGSEVLWSTGAMPSRSIAVVTGARSARSWLTVSVRPIRLKFSAFTPGIPSSALRNSPSSVGQSIFSMR